jgi:protein SCO1/2
MCRASKAEPCCGPDRGLLALLREDAPIYVGLGATEAGRLRAFVMECVGLAGLAPDALPFIREELETAMDAYLIAAAARAVRRLPSVPPDIEQLLLGAVERVSAIDEIVHLDSYPAPQAASGRSAIAEVMETLAMAGLATRREVESFARTDAPNDSIARLRDVELEDQDGQVTTFGQLFIGRPSVLTFFYSRCMNPNKCSRTIGRLGALQRMIEDTDTVVAAITYDPAYDLPKRLRRYGEDRGFRFGPRWRLLRPKASFDQIREALHLAVGYGDATVNRHAVELLVSDAGGRLVASWMRQQWDERDVASALLCADRAFNDREL